MADARPETRGPA